VSNLQVVFFFFFLLLLLLLLFFFIKVAKLLSSFQNVNKQLLNDSHGFFDGLIN